ncbi:HNH endonuclease signature motif containing protein [Actinotalea sp. AC32]|nr:HNH endonuclease signature motif containing protein [Actinotalea sp. AC32]
MPPARSRQVRYARRRRRRMAAVEHDLSATQWAALVEAWGGCAYCGATGVPLQRDCVLPISRGGRYTLANIAPACASCNASKCNDEVTGWLRRKRLDERAFLERHVRIQAALAAGSAGSADSTGSTGPVAHDDDVLGSDGAPSA